MKLILMRSIPGGGKTTYIATHAAPDAVVCSADSYFMDRVSGRYNFDPSKLSAAHAECFRKCVETLSRDYDDRDEEEPSEVYVDNTNLSAVELAPYVALAAAYDVECEIVTISCSPEMARRNVHGVPDHALVRMANVLAGETLPPFWNVKRRERLAER